MDADTLKGMAVISMQEGTRLGRVEQGLFDLAARQLRAVEVHGDAGTFIVPFEQIERIGSDAITVVSSQVTQTPNTASAVGTLLGLHEIGKLKVVDSVGTYLGTLGSVEIDAMDGRITQLSAHKGGMLGLGGTTTPVDALALLVVGPELLTVTMPAGSTPPAT